MTNAHGPEHSGFPTPENQEREQFDRGACIRHTLTDISDTPILSPLSSGTMGPPARDIESRYLTPDEVLSIGNYQKSLAGAGVVIKAFKSAIPFKRELTDEEIAQKVAASREALNSFGLRVIDIAKAKAHNAVMTLSSSDTAYLIDHPFVTDSGEAMIAYAKGGYGEFEGTPRQRKGWAILNTKHEQIGPVLVKLTDTSEDVGPTFQVVKLDEVFLNGDAREEFLALMRDYHEKDAVSRAVEVVAAGLATHEIDATEVVPDFILKLAEIDDPVQRLQEITDIQKYLVWLHKTGSNNAARVSNFQRDLGSMQVATDYGRTITTDSYLQHMTSCPAQPDSGPRLHSEMLTLSQSLQHIGEDLVPFGPDDDYAYAPVVANPSALTYGLYYGTIAGTVRDEGFMKRDYEERGPNSNLAKTVLAERFMTEVGMTLQDIQRLASLTADRQTRLSAPRVDPDVYDPLFNALALHNLKTVNMYSSVFQSFFREFIKKPEFEIPAGF